MSGDLEREKARLRSALSTRRRQVSRAAADDAGRAVAEHLAGCEAVGAANRVALYAALPDELPTRPCFDLLRARGVETCLPVVEEGGLAFRAVERWEELRPGRYGVPEPPLGAPGLVLAPGDLALVPGVAFDAGGARLGRGGGHYDAAFPPGVGGPTLFGVGYELQVIAHVPHGSRDRSMDAIVTECGIRWAKTP